MLKLGLKRIGRNINFPGVGADYLGKRHLGRYFAKRNRKEPKRFETAYDRYKKEKEARKSVTKDYSEYLSRNKRSSRYTSSQSYDTEESSNYKDEEADRLRKERDTRISDTQKNKRSYLNKYKEQENTSTSTSSSFKYGSSGSNQKGSWSDNIKSTEEKPLSKEELNKLREKKKEDFEEGRPLSSLFSGGSFWRDYFFFSFVYDIASSVFSSENRRGSWYSGYDYSNQNIWDSEQGSDEREEGTAGDWIQEDSGKEYEQGWEPYETPEETQDEDQGLENLFNSEDKEEASDTNEVEEKEESAGEESPWNFGSEDDEDKDEGSGWGSFSLFGDSNNDDDDVSDGDSGGSFWDDLGDFDSE